MTGNNDKLRSLFLTALMVMSVFAMTVTFVGGAAANHGEDVEIDSAVHYVEEDGTDNVEIVLDGQIDSSPDVRLGLDDGTYVSNQSGTVAGNGRQITLTDDLDSAVQNVSVYGDHPP